jgi:hypothetical protein
MNEAPRYQVLYRQGGTTFFGPSFAEEDKANESLRLLRERQPAVEAWVSRYFPCIGGD